MMQGGRARPPVLVSY